MGNPFEEMPTGALPKAERRSLPFNNDQRIWGRYSQITKEKLNKENVEWDEVSFELPRLKVLLSPEEFSELNIDEKLFDSFSDTIAARKEAGPGAFLYALAGAKQVFPDKLSESGLLDESFNDQEWQELKKYTEKLKENREWHLLIGTLKDLKIVSEGKFQEFSSIISNEDLEDIMEEVGRLKRDAEAHDERLRRRSDLEAQGYEFDPIALGRWDLLIEYCADLKQAFPEKFNPADHIDPAIWSNKIARQYGLQYQQENSIGLTGWGSLDMAANMKIISDLK